jgi:RepB DNA-primase from phage plasmid
MEKLFQKLARYFLNLWHLGVLHPEKGLWTMEPSLEKIAYLKAQNAKGCHILIKPLYLAHYLLADDIPWDTLTRQHRLPNGQWKPARMVVETSPGNFQVWIHSKRALSLQEKRVWLNRMKSDPAAHPENRWGRCPGFRNTKEKHRSPAGLFPLARLIWIDWASQAQIPILDPSGPKPPILSHPSRRGPVCHLSSLSREHFRKSDESSTDFAYAISLARRGLSDHQIRARILSERTNWSNHKGERRINHYLHRTIRRARQIVNST